MIAPSLAHEHIWTYEYLRLLAVIGARRGFVVVRFSWTGQGDSESAPPGTDLADAWRDDLAAAVEAASAVSGMGRVDAIGLRVGAAVLASTPELPIGSRVLWEPIGGRAFLRQQAVLRKLALPDSLPISSTGVELSSQFYDDVGADSIRALVDPRTIEPGRLPVGTHIVETDADVLRRYPEIARLFRSDPHGAIDAVLARLTPSPPAALPPWEPIRETVVVDREAGAEVRQTFVEVGRDRLPGVYSTPVGTALPVAALLIPASVEAKGVNRLWAPASRHLAARGMPNLRADRRGVGDAKDIEDFEVPIPLRMSAVDDVARSVRWLSDRTGSPVSVVGVCSGGWLGVLAADKVPIRRLVMINMLAWRRSSRHWPQFFLRDEMNKRAAEDAGAAPVLTDHEVVPAAPSAPRGIVARLKHVYRRHTPYALQLAIAKLDIGDYFVETVLGPVPPETGIRLVFGAADHGWYLKARGARASERLRKRGRRIDVLLDERADHSLVSQLAFESVMDALDRELEDAVEEATGTDARQRSVRPSRDRAVPTGV
ncbi:hypothetical protein [Agromyces larvae]|uniref:Alpha/beta hydrolase n=1 Tax=Agromyces larvae TaxID=2929802 RepID=A0ABY4BYG6_9MICO|nr:hypothetical protein [Agromyces larvae]UOE42763.1 hypothetical protein MTO99_11230 [Agromyces larvae]